MQKTVITTNFEETRQLGVAIAKTLKGGEVLALYGDLGSGKTTFMQGLAQGLGITKHILSPTFLIMRSYDITGEKESAKGNGTKYLYHLDLYRIENEKDVEGLGLLDLMDDPENIVAIEWPDKLETLLPKNASSFYFAYLGDDKREIRYNDRQST